MEGGKKDSSESLGMEIGGSPTPFPSPSPSLFVHLPFNTSSSEVQEHLLHPFYVELSVYGMTGIVEETRQGLKKHRPLQPILITVLPQPCCRCAMSTVTQAGCTHSGLSKSGALFPMKASLFREGWFHEGSSEQRGHWNDSYEPPSEGELNTLFAYEFSWLSRQWSHHGWASNWIFISVIRHIPKWWN